MNVKDMFDLSGKVAVVTGAGSGLGAQISEAMAEAGANVVCGDINVEGNEATVERIKELGINAIAVSCDVSDEEQVAMLFQKAKEEYGSVDIAFAVAGIAGPPPMLLHEHNTEDWKKALDINLNGVFYTNREAVKIMKDQGKGKIINMASMWGLTGPSGLFPNTSYSAAKGGVVNLTREIALQYAPYNIQVNAICPGFFKTSLGGEDVYSNVELVKQMEDSTPLGRVAEAEEIKGTALYLASDASNFTTGLMLVTDGGYIAQ